MNHRNLGADDDAYNVSETQQLVNTLYINIIIFSGLMALFEFLRHMKSIYMNRLKRKFMMEHRVPEKPSSYPLGWIWTVMSVPHDEVLRMVGLDGYMLLRYLNACVRIASFCAFWGLTVMIPIYGSGRSGLTGWNKYTLANIPDDPGSNALWVPVIFCYLFSIFYCQLMYYEFKNFIKKRVSYLEEGDADTPVQTYYTVMLEKIPSSLRSNKILTDFFDRLFPGDVYTVEIALDLNQLDEIVEHRKKVRSQLEKAIAVWKATGNRPTTLVDPKLYEGVAGRPHPLSDFTIFTYCGYERYDSIEHFSKLLEMLNENVRKMQAEFFEQRQKVDEIEGNRLKELHKVLAVRAFENASSQVKKLAGNIKALSPHQTLVLPGAFRKSQSPGDVDQEEETSPPGLIQDDQHLNSESRKSDLGTDDSKRSGFLEAGSARAHEAINIAHKIVGTGMEGLAKEGLKTAEFATRGALRGVYEATRALELLTLGAYYRTASTAFVTFRTRFSSCCCQQMLLSHDHYMIDVAAAPNPNDIIWANVSIPSKQIEIRKYISNGIILVGALFWSIVVTFISAISNLESISREIPALQAYSNTTLYKFFNNYLAVGILLILLALLPFIFDFISRNYEGLKLESEIQNSIMSRYFYYQLANVFVAVGLGSIANSLHEILSDPASILTILGNSVPSFSIYFANLIITRTFTGIPIEMLRIFPLIDIVRVMFCSNKNKYTRRELSAGAFADPPMLFGWIYPNILMGVMIMVAYCCIAPFIMLFCAVFFAFLYLMYKYQLLYVYINNYQSGGYMWYAVFDSSMLALLCGVIILTCYLAIRQTFVSGPFYVILPLPVLIFYFWNHCNAVFKKPASTLSLERAKEMDEILRNSHIDVTVNGEFDINLFRQPSLVEGNLRPAAYRNSMIHTTLQNFGTDTNIDSEAYHEDDLLLKHPEVEHEIDELLDVSPSKKVQTAAVASSSVSPGKESVKRGDIEDNTYATVHSPIIKDSKGSTEIEMGGRYGSMNRN